jgi:hypothetical protein
VVAKVNDIKHLLCHSLVRLVVWGSKAEAAAQIALRIIIALVKENKFEQSA